MTLLEQIADDLEYKGSEIQLSVWRDSELHEVTLVWNGASYDIRTTD